MSVILTTTLFYKALVLQGEIWCWSLLALKGLSMWNRASTKIYERVPNNGVHETEGTKNFIVEIF